MSRPRVYEQRCSFEGCPKPSHTRGFCRGHVAQQRRGATLAPLRRCGGNSFGDGHIDQRGYRVVKAPPGGWGARADGFILEHRLVMAQAIGRALRPDEEVHHLNGDRADNRLENLELWSGSHPRGQRIEDKVEWAIGILALYRPEILQRDQALV